MSNSRTRLQRDFETALVDVLSQDYNLDVRNERDPLERRRRDTATLRFAYHHQGGSSRARVVISVDGVPGFSNLLPVNFRSRAAVLRAAEDCEALARFIDDHLTTNRGRTLEALVAGQLRYGRREEDPG